MVLVRGKESVEGGPGEGEREGKDGPGEGKESVKDGPGEGEGECGGWSW